MNKDKDTRARKVKIDSEEGKSQEMDESAMNQAEIAELAADFEALQAEVTKLQRDSEEAHNRYLRTMADFDNFRKRQRDETNRLCDFARERILTEIIPIVDNFERSVDAAEAQHSYDALVEGVTLTLRQLKDVLVKEGIESIDAAGQQFDPEFHEALMRVPTEEYPENTVVDVLEKGYVMNGKVIRPARVRVSVAPE